MKRILTGRLRARIEYHNLEDVLKRLYMMISEISVPAVHVPMGQYHTCKSLESGTVIIEFKNTKYDPLTTEDVHEKKE